MQKVYIRDVNSLELIDFFYVDKTNIGTDKWNEYFMTEPKIEKVHTFWYEDNRWIVYEDKMTQVGKEDFDRYRPDY